MHFRLLMLSSLVCLALIAAACRRLPVGGHFSSTALLVTAPRTISRLQM